MQLKAPTNLTPELVRKYQELCRKEFGISLSKEEAHNEGLALVEFYVALLQAEMENIKNGCGVIDLTGK